MTDLNRFDCISPIDYRYHVAELIPTLSENGFTYHKLLVEKALVTVFHRRGLLDADVRDEIFAACDAVTTQEVYDEEDRIRHDIRALVNCIQRKVGDRAKPFVHMTATSFDIVDTANVKRYRTAVDETLVPALRRLLRTLAIIAGRDAETLQIGRTHGQHAVPISFGFAMAGYSMRLAECIDNIERAARGLRGQFSGAVGAFNASHLFFDDPRQFEREVLAELGLEAAPVSTQIVPPEPLIRLFFEVFLAGGLAADIARSMRQLMRSEICEIGEAFGADQVGSSTMPHKRNPINFENIESMWKVVHGRIMSILLDQLSEHQRDLTNSASGRTYGEIIAYVYGMIVRLDKTMSKLTVDHDSLARNFAQNSGTIIAEPLYILLAAYGHPDAHEAVRKLTLQAQLERLPLQDVVAADASLRPFIEQFTDRQRAVLADPALYVGIAPEIARRASEWCIGALDSTEQLKGVSQSP